MGFWEQHGDAVILGVFLFVAYLACLVLALRQQRRTYEGRLARVRRQRDRAKTVLRQLRRRSWVTNATPAAINAEFEAMVAADRKDGAR